MPRISVVMVTRDRRERVLATLERLLALPEQPPVLLVDNASADGTAEAVARAFPSVTVLRQDRNLGAVGRNVGVAAASTPYVAFADDDSWWAPGSLQRAVEHLDACPRLAVLAARVLVGPQERLDPVCALMARSPLPREPGLPGPPVLGFLACGAVVRREALLAVGGFSPVLGFLGEEEVLSQDLETAGWRLAYVDDVVAHHHPATAGPRAGRARLQRRNALLSVWLRRPLPVVVRRTARAVADARDPDSRGALLDAVTRLPAVLPNRRRLPGDVERRLRLLERAGAGSSPGDGRPESRAAPEAAVRDVRLLYVDGCPNWQETAVRLREALDRLGLPVAPSLVRVQSADDAERLGLCGSPTVLLDGVDAFAGQAPPTALSCRVFRTPDGVGGAPTVEQLVEALRARRP